MTLLLTTSRKPSNKTRSFCKDLEKVFPKSSYVQRGKKAFNDVISFAEEQGKNAILIVSESKGNPRELSFLLRNENGWAWGPAIKIKGVKLIRETCGKKFAQFKDLKIVTESKENFFEDILGKDYFEEDSKLELVISENFSKMHFTWKGDVIGPTITIEEVMRE